MDNFCGFCDETLLDYEKTIYGMALCCKLIMVQVNCI